jgi:hypothetical protein
MPEETRHSAARDARNESEAARLDRNYGELLQELRVSETGVQILFAFMLSIAFQQRFQSIDSFQRTVYVLTLICCTLSVALLVAPVSFHRLVFRQGLKEQLVMTASRLATAGITFLLLSVLSGVLLILDYVVGRAFAVITTSILSLIFVLLWIALPLYYRATHEQ